MKWKLKGIVGCVLALSLVGTGCAANKDAEARPLIIVSTYALEYVTTQLVGEQADVVALITPGVEPHDLELTSAQVQQIATADLVVYQAGFQAAVDLAVAQTSPDKVIDVVSAVELLASEEGADPHIWLDPVNMGHIAKAIAARLETVLPSSADIAVAEVVAAFERLDADYASGLRTCRIRTFVPSHAAFAYLAKRYELVQVPIAGLDPNIEPTLARIAQVHEIALEHGVTTIFYEAMVSDAVARALAADLKLAVDVLDPVEAYPKEGDYESVMRANLAALRRANGCE
ncbi:MAG: metal ABC transporter substrate-binding protein [Propionibacteriaceae bacterium]|jgi:zinc transport system substrate-binding protein|nr:metal ABC transporter substrate-binding protein [Propionibacteriaceae bacterium]